jgi:hypothetical protein
LKKTKKDINYKEIPTVKEFKVRCIFEEINMNGIDKKN